MPSSNADKRTGSPLVPPIYSEPEHNSENVFYHIKIQEQNSLEAEYMWESHMCHLLAVLYAYISYNKERHKQYICGILVGKRRGLQYGIRCNQSYTK